MGDTGRHEPHHLDAITDAELQRALADRDPLRGIAQLTARLGPRRLDPAGAPQQALGRTDDAKLRDACPAATAAAQRRVGVRAPILAPEAALRHDAFVVDHLRNERTRLATAPRRVKPSTDLDLDELDSRSRVVAHTSVPPARAANGTGRDRGGDAPGACAV